MDFLMRLHRIPLERCWRLLQCPYRVHESACHPTPEPRDASGRTVRTEREKPVATEAGCACVCHRPTRAHLGESR
ncbi:unnamed protein product [Boreogadus saida]